MRPSRWTVDDSLAVAVLLALALAGWLVLALH